METHQLTKPENYDPGTQRVIGVFAAQLDDQLRNLKKTMGTPSISELEWQMASGMNTIGVLLAHCAIAEAFWINVAPLGLGEGPEADRRIRQITGIGGSDDGLPLPPGGTHPDTLRNLSLDDYLGMLDGAREATHAILMSWKDEDLDDSYAIEQYHFSKAWTIYHVLEHFVGHFGQIRLLKRIIKDRGLV